MLHCSVVVGKALDLGESFFFSFLWFLFVRLLLGFGVFFLCTVVVGQNIVPHCNIVALLDPGTMEHGLL